MRLRALALSLTLLGAVGVAAWVPSVNASAVDQGVDQAAVHKALASETGWTHHSTDDGLRIDEKHIDALDATAFVGRFVLDPGVSDAKLFELLSNSDLHLDVNPNLHESRTIGHTGGADDVLQVLKKPSMMPVSERYWFIRSVTTLNVGGVSGHLRRTWSSIPGSTYPLEIEHIQSTYPDAVEVRYSYGMWEIIPNASGPSTLVYRTVSHPGGEVPVWVLNQVISHTMTSNMRSFEAAALKASQ